MNTPEVRIQSSMLIFNSISDDERKLWASSTGQDSMDFSAVHDYAAQLSEAWGVYGEQLLTSMCSLYGIEFKKILSIYMLAPGISLLVIH